MDGDGLHVWMWVDGWMEDGDGGSEFGWRRCSVLGGLRHVFSGAGVRPMAGGHGAWNGTQC